MQSLSTRQCPVPSIIPPPPRLNGGLWSTTNIFQDRGSRLVTPTVARKHLPPPPLGETMGHGLSPPRYGGPGSVRRKAADDAQYGSDSGGGAGGGIANDGLSPPPGTRLRTSCRISFCSEPRGGMAGVVQGAGGRERYGGGGKGEPLCASLSPKTDGAEQREGRRGRSGMSEKFPLLPAAQALSAAAAAEEGGGGGSSLKGKRGWAARRASSLGAQTRGGWIRSRQTPETLQELLQTT